MFTTRTTFALAALALSLVACGKKDETPAAGGGPVAAANAAGQAAITSASDKPLGACNKVSNVGKCTEYDMSKDPLGVSKGGCEATDGKWQTAACPTDKTFASCTTGESKIIYYAGTTPKDSLLTMDEEFAKLDCEMMSGKLAITGSSKAVAGPGEAKPAAASAKKAPAAAPKKK